jgi:hypothetical protein
MSRLSPSLRRRVQNNIAPRLPSICANAGLPAGHWRRAIRAGETDWDEQERVWREAPPHAPLRLPAGIRMGEKAPLRRCLKQQV